MILIDAEFWGNVGVVFSDGNSNGNQYDFYNYIEMSNGETINNQYGFFKNSPVDGVYYDNQLDWYRAIGVLYSEPIIDMDSFYNNVTFDNVNPIGNQYDFFKGLIDELGFTSLCSFNFDDSSKHLTVPNLDLRDICTGANKSYTFGCSVKQTTTGVAGSVFSDHHSLTSKRIDVAFNAGGAMFLLQYNVGVKIMLANDIVTGNWVNATLVVDGNNPSNNRIDVNGISMPLSNNSLTGSVATSTNDFQIGRDGTVPAAPF